MPEGRNLARESVLQIKRSTIALVVIKYYLTHGSHDESSFHHHLASHVVLKSLGQHTVFQSITGTALQIQSCLLSRKQA